MAPPSPTLSRGRDANGASSRIDEDEPIGPLSGPSSPRWRRQRLLNLGSDRSSRDETSILRSDLSHQPSYGSLPHAAARARKSKSKLNLRRGIVSLQGINIPRMTASEASSPTRTSPVSFRDSLAALRSRPVSAYDTSNFQDMQEPRDAEMDVKTNGIRVWYSSFTSIDWLHDAIKDSARQARLRRRKSTRGRFIRQIDRSIGWIIVTIVGFLTAIVAFMIVRSEQWLFDLKEGYCSDSWHKSKRFCCPVVEDVSIPRLRPLFLNNFRDEDCAAWRTWANVFGPALDGNKWILLESEMIEYIAYIIIAVSFRASI